jgi:DNA polymerase IV
MIEQRGLTLLGVSVGNLRNAGAVQLTLPFERAEMIELEAALDAVRDRFGSTSITSAGSIGTDAGFTVPMLPD